MVGFSQVGRRLSAKPNRLEVSFQTDLPEVSAGAQLQLVRLCPLTPPGQFTIMNTVGGCNALCCGKVGNDEPRDVFQVEARKESL